MYTTIHTKISTATKTLVSLLALLVYVIFSCSNRTIAYSLPEYFPDLSHYKLVNIEPYYTWYFNGPVVNFQNSHNTRCGFEFGDSIYCLWYSYRTPANIANEKTLQCQEAYLQDFDNEELNIYSKKPAKITIENPKKCVHYNDIKVIPTGYKISFKGNTCAIGENNLIACTNTRHGFIISNTQTQRF